MKSLNRKNERGITLIALIVTIIVLIILALISMNAVLGEDGIVNRAKKAKDEYERAVEEEYEALNIFEQHISNSINDEVIPENPNKKPLVTTIKDTNHEGIEAVDALGNPVKMPGGFKISNNSGNTVKDGIVIQDDNDNEFVWIPVSNLNGDGTGKIKVDANNEVEITLGRYSFKDATKSVNLVQLGEEYAQTTYMEVARGNVTQYEIDDYLYELSDYQTSSQDMNECAKNLRGFIESVEENHGYYIARYEASYVSGTDGYGEGNDKDYVKIASKKSTNALKEWDYTKAEKGDLMNSISQINAAKASRQMYYGNTFVESDLCNSYAWDTALIYIKKMGNEEYLFQRFNDSPSDFTNTGETEDEVCKIFDMSGNAGEWTTEHGRFFDDDQGYGYPFIYRAGSSYFAGMRIESIYSNRNDNISFRPILYIL